MKIKNLLTVAIILCLFATCKKTENPYTLEPKYSGSVQVGFSNYVDGTGAFGFISKALTFKDTLLNAEVEIKIANTTGTAPNQIKVYLAKNDAVVYDYNNMNGTSYLPVSATSSAVNLDFTQPVIINRGERTARIPLLINPSKLGSAPLALGIVLQKAEGADIQEIQNKLVIAISALNKYDGYYQSKGSAYHPTYGNYSWNSQGVFACGDGFALITSGVNSVDLSPGQPLQNGTVLSFFSAVVPRFTVDPLTNKVSIASTIPATIFVQYPAYNSRYDPATKSFFIKFGWSGDRVATDTFTYCGPR